VGAEKEGEYAELAGRRIGAAERGGVLRELRNLVHNQATSWGMDR
jgi:hypothetical protein